ncbi:MAG: DNA primase [Patescibacteria group bacterium]|jgi:DNA primase
MSSQIEEIKARVDIVDLISEYIRLKQAGANNWKALCPFHNEKTPSFMVSKDKQFWHCFGCSEGGDIFTFIQKIEGIEFPEALRLLAQKAGVKLVAENPELSSQRNRLLDVIQLAADFWHQTLLTSPSAQKARDYLKKRKVEEKIIAEFKLGYAPDSWDNLIKFLKSRRFSDSEIFLAGLSVKKERGSDFYDRFRDRLMFPINDLQGSPIGFSGRTLKVDEQGGKYINTPQTLVYNKSLAVFNLDKARSEIKKQDLAIIVEGQMDVLASVQAGTENVIASSGTALTLDQLKILKRYTKNLAMAFDMDIAGEGAAKRGIDLALSEEMNVKVIVLPKGKDPDECIKNNPADWLAAVKNAKSIMEYYFDQTFARLNLSKVEDKKTAAKILLPVINKIGNKIEQTHWLQKLAESLKVSEKILWESIAKQEVKRSSVDSKNVPNTAKDRNLMLIEQILAIALKHPTNISYLVANVTPDLIGDNQLNCLYKKLVIYYTDDIKSNKEIFDLQEFHSKLQEQELAALTDKLVLLAEKDFFDFDSETIRDEMIKAVNFFKRDCYNCQLKEVSEKLKLAETNGKDEEVKKFIEQFNEVVAQLNILD